MQIQDFAKKIGMTKQNLSRILSRDIKLTEGTAQKIADALEIEPWYLIYGIAARPNALKSAILQRHDS
jgi:transcriptional regulator with XRE-family HTH domain